MLFPRRVPPLKTGFLPWQKPDSGIVSAVEFVPAYYLYRRRIVVSGLQNATVRFFGERYCAGAVHAVLNSYADASPDVDPLEAQVVHSEEYGTN